MRIETIHRTRPLQAGAGLRFPFHGGRCWRALPKGHRSVNPASLHLPRRAPESPVGAGDDRPGQESFRASVTLGSRHPRIPEPGRCGTATPASRARWPAPGVPGFLRAVTLTGRLLVLMRDFEGVFSESDHPSDRSRRPGHARRTGHRRGKEVVFKGRNRSVGGD